MGPWCDASNPHDFAKHGCIFSRKDSKWSSMMHINTRIPRKINFLITSWNNFDKFASWFYEMGWLKVSWFQNILLVFSNLPKHQEAQIFKRISALKRGQIKKALYTTTHFLKKARFRIKKITPTISEIIWSKMWGQLWFMGS